MTSADELRRSIEPGSTEYGDRQELEAGLSSAVQPGAPAQSPQASAQTAAGNPLAALLGGDINPNQAEDLPTTAGLSVGPGPGPYGADTEDPRMVKLRQAATTARSPELRQIARNELRRLVREGK